MRSHFSILFLLTISLSTSASIINVETNVLSEFPAPLTVDNFEETMATGLHLVEFFSPYCYHCKQLAPIWKSTWERFQKENSNSHSGISFDQVNCIESGDLCAEQKIDYYPNIRLYGPSGHIKTYPTDAGRTEDDFIKFVKQEALELNEMSDSLVDNDSILFSGLQLLKILKNGVDQPWVVSFWPTKDMKNTDDVQQFDNCENCKEFQKKWKLLLNKWKLKNISSAHFNCKDDVEICKELGFQDLTRNSKKNKHPEVALILPNKIIGNIVIYEKNINSLSSYEKFVDVTLSNALVPTITVSDLESKLEISKDFSLDSLENTDPNIYVVFAYNPKTIFREDFEILEHLIDPLAKLSNVYLYKTTDDVMSFTRQNYDKMITLINYDDKEEKFSNEVSFIMNTLTQYPTFFIFKTNSLTPTVFHGYSTTEMRNLPLILEWINQDSLPLFNKILTVDDFYDILNFQNSHYETLVVQMIDSKEKDLSGKFLKNTMVAAYDYDYTRNSIFTENVLKRRINKQNVADLMKERNDPPPNIIAKMYEEVPHEYNCRVLLSFLDLKENAELLDNLGLNIHNRIYSNGDILIVDKKKGTFYYEKDISGEYLTAESPYHLKETLLALNFPGKFRGVKLYRNLINSPFRNSLRSLDYIHQYGLFGYLAIIVIIGLVIKFPRYLKKYKILKKYYPKKT